MLAALIVSLVLGASQTTDTAAPVVTPPDWAARPEGLDRALRKVTGGGLAAVRCRVTAQGRAADCRIVGESPAGHNLGDAVLCMSRRFKFVPRTVDGRAVDTGAVIVPVEFAFDAIATPDLVLEPDPTATLLDTLVVSRQSSRRR